MQKSENSLPWGRSQERWAQFRLSVIGPLLAAPPDPGQLQTQLRALAAKKWRHPISGAGVVFGFSSLERWYYKALRAKANAVAALQRKIRADLGEHPSISTAVAARLTEQYRQHPSWSYQLHAENLALQVTQDAELVSAPSYVSVWRYMKAHGLFKRPRRGPVHSPGAQAAEQRLEAREVRSYESEYVNGLWHLDFHHGSLRVLPPDGQWAYPLLLGILDDHSRLGCHLQWYLAEGAQELCHGLCQAFEKRDLPRSILFDNGAAMIAAETQQGLARLGILAENTLPFSPYQNGKMEVFWGQIEGRLLPMLEGVSDLTLALLNEATQAWVEGEYHRKVHSETGQTPLERFLNDKNVGQPCPPAAQLRLAFTQEEPRVQRRSDGTLSLKSRRFEIPGRFAHLEKLAVRYAAWDLSRVYLADPKTGTILGRLYPQDKTKNAQGHRAPRTPVVPAPPAVPSGMAPLLQHLLQQHAATGLPPAYQMPTLRVGRWSPALNQQAGAERQFLPRIVQVAEFAGEIGRQALARYRGGQGLCLLPQRRERLRRSGRLRGRLHRVEQHLHPGLMRFADRLRLDAGRVVFLEAGRGQEVALRLVSAGERDIVEPGGTLGLVEFEQHQGRPHRAGGSHAEVLLFPVVGAGRQVHGMHLGLGWTEADLMGQRKKAPGKLDLAARLRREVTMSLKWIAPRVHLGTSKSANGKLHAWMKNPTNLCSASNNMGHPNPSRPNAWKTNQGMD